jgi:hypothetical protein
MSLMLLKAGPSTPALNPASISGARARWTAGVLNFSDAGTTPAAADGTVQQVNDRIGSFTLSQATAGNRPTLRLVSGRWEWEFDGTADNWRLADGTILAAYPHTVFAIVRMLGTANGAIFSWGTTATEGGICSGWGSTSIDGLGDNTVSLFGGARHIVGAADGVASGILRLGYRYADNGATASSRFSATGYTSVTDTGAEPIAAQNGACVGNQRNDNGGTTRFLTGNCRLMDLVVYDRSLTDQEMADLMSKPIA